MKQRQKVKVQRTANTGRNANTSKKFLSVGAAVLCALYRGQAIAADEQPGAAPNDQSRGELGEVVVTARRREENVQDVPISMTVLSPEVLKRNNIQSLEDLQILSPSLSFVATQDRDNPTITIRGQGPSPGAGPSVVTYLDEVPMPINQTTGSAVGGPGFFYDLDNIQILKGPQGTLFGRNTTGGAILVQSARPKDDFEGYAQVTYGNYDDREVDAALNAPIIDHTLLVRFATSYQDREGFTQQVDEPGRAIDNTDRKSARLSIRFQPNDAVQNDLIYSFANITSNGTSALLGAVNPALATSLGYPQLPGLLAQQQALGPRAELQTDQALFMERDYWGITDIFRYNITPDFTFRNIAGYTLLHYRLGVDWDGTDLPLFQFAQGTYAPGIPAPLHFNTYTEEPQLQGTALNGNLTWQVGAFYLTSPAGQFSASNTSILGVGDKLLTRLESHSEAVYTQETYDLSSLAQGLKITGGYRYTWDHQFAQEVGLNGSGQCVSSPATNCETTGAANFSAPTWTVDIDYQLTHDTMVYIANRRGYRDGGFNTNSSIATSVSAFGPEHLTDNEIGIKSEWSIGGVRARTNFDLYIDDYQGIQVPVDTVEDGTIVQLTENGANARIEGSEFDGTIFPTENWQIGATFSSTEFEYTNSSSGAQLTEAHEFPKWKYSVSTKYQLPVPAGLGDVSASANWGWQGHSFIGPEGDPLAATSPYGLLNLGLSWEHISGGPLDASFFMTNALNKVYAINDASFYSFFGASTLTYGLPRMYGVRLNYRF